MTGIKAFKERYQDARQCAWCGEAVEDSGVYWAELRIVVHQDACNLALHDLSRTRDGFLRSRARSTTDVFRLLAERTV